MMRIIRHQPAGRAMPIAAFASPMLTGDLKNSSMNFNPRQFIIPVLGVLLLAGAQVNAEENSDMSDMSDTLNMPKSTPAYYPFRHDHAPTIKELDSQMADYMSNPDRRLSEDTTSDKIHRRLEEYTPSPVIKKDSGSEATWGKVIQFSNFKYEYPARDIRKVEFPVAYGFSAYFEVKIKPFTATLNGGWYHGDFGIKGPHQGSTKVGVGVEVVAGLQYGFSQKRYEIWEFPWKSVAPKGTSVAQYDFACEDKAYAEVKGEFSPNLDFSSARNPREIRQEMALKFPVSLTGKVGAKANFGVRKKNSHL